MNTQTLTQRRTFRCRIVRLNDGFTQYMTYIGPMDRIPDGWSLVARRVVTRAAA